MEPLIMKLGLALAIGLLVGLERGWREREAPAGSRTAGIRTYGISGLLGGVVAALAAATANAWLLPMAFLAFSMAFAWFKWQESERDEDFSFTGVAAALAVFALGGLAVAGDHAAAAAAGAALTAVLASRDMLHGLLRRISWPELRSAVILAVMTAIVLPLLPDRPVDPWGALNPREVWLFTVFAAALSYLGYIATRVLGPARGLLLSCLAGALVSSTAMTLALARTNGSGLRLAGAACLAAMVSVLRVMAVVLVLSPAVLVKVGPPAVAVSLAFAAIGFGLFASAGSKDVPSATDRNPFDLAPLLIFALLFAAVSIAGALVSGYFGNAGLVITSALSGAIDVDVGVLSALHFGRSDMSGDIISQAVLAAVAANALVRLTIGVAAGSRAFGLPLAAANCVAAAAGVATFLILPPS